VERYKEDSSQFWEDIYLANNAGWDLGGPTPVFQKLSETMSAGKICILGCGKGHDAVEFSQKGFEVTAVDFSKTAVHNLKTLALARNVPVSVIQDDIFSLTPKYRNSFDYILEQTCFCAINPNRRIEYEKLVFSLLKYSGKLIGLWFPLDKSREEGGPPYGTKVDEVKSIFSSPWKIEVEEFSDLSIKTRKGREKLIIFKKENNE
tara:strand:+ start:2200 stop:2814 length:615 start_codon:yes stop_codon:yes gene_type:complete